MEFTFSAPAGSASTGSTPAASTSIHNSSLPAKAFSFPTSTAFSFPVQASSLHQQHESSILMDHLQHEAPDDSYGRIAQTRAHGVGDTAQWRQRVLHHIEGRIKDKRASLQNARRSGLQQSLSHEHSRQQQQQALLSSSSIQQQRDPSILTSETVGSQAGFSSHSSFATDVISPEEEQRIVAEVWEAFKNENFATFQTLTDSEIEDIEGDIMRLKPVNEYDPTYEAMLDVEQEDMQESIEHYMLLERCAVLERENAEMASALSLAITILSNAHCFRCRQGRFSFESIPRTDVLETSEKSRTLDMIGTSATSGGGIVTNAAAHSLSPSTSGESSGMSTGTMTARAGCAVCGLCLEELMLVYIAEVARNHSRGCASQLQFDYDSDAGLLAMCATCDYLA
ncbi:hypothetical protein BGZ94_002943 [Podila epigama]|nr:hypothetical protein BGZ94_002943 [Podila epigama]